VLLRLASKHAVEQTHWVIFVIITLAFYYTFGESAALLRSGDIAVAAKLVENFNDARARYQQLLRFEASVTGLL
jgi:hypothetical protein